MARQWPSGVQPDRCHDPPAHDTLGTRLRPQPQEAAHAIPDARQRLSYISEMTEQAASRCQRHRHRQAPGQAPERRRSLRPLGPPLRQPAEPGRVPRPGRRDPEFLGGVVSDTRETNAQLLEIMMAQDFQDLTGQVIKKVVDLAQGLEQQLLQVLLEAMPAERKTEASESS